MAAFLVAGVSTLWRALRYWNPLRNLWELLWGEDQLVLHSVVELFFYARHVLRVVSGASERSPASSQNALAPPAEQPSPRMRPYTPQLVRAAGAGEAAGGVFQAYNAMDTPPFPGRAGVEPTEAARALDRQRYTTHKKLVRKIDRGERELDLLICGLQGMCLLWILFITLVVVLSSYSAGFSEWLHAVLSTGSDGTGEGSFLPTLPRDSSAPLVDKLTGHMVQIGRGAMRNQRLEAGPQAPDIGFTKEFLAWLRVCSVAFLLNWNGGSRFAMSDFLPYAILLFTLGYQLASVLRHSLAASATLKKEQEQEAVLAETRRGTAHLEDRAAPSRYYQVWDLLKLGAAWLLPTLYTFFAASVGLGWFVYRYLPSEADARTGGAAPFSNPSVVLYEAFDGSGTHPSAGRAASHVLAQLLLVSNLHGWWADYSSVGQAHAASEAQTDTDTGIYYIASKVSLLYAFPSTWMVMCAVQIALLVMFLQWAMLKCYRTAKHMRHAKGNLSFSATVTEDEASDDLSTYSEGTFYRYERSGDSAGQQYRIPAASAHTAHFSASSLLQPCANLGGASIAFISSAAKAAYRKVLRWKFAWVLLKGLSAHMYVYLITKCILARIVLAIWIIPRASVAPQGTDAFAPGAQRAASIAQASFLGLVGACPLTRLDALLCGMIYYYAMSANYSMYDMYLYLSTSASAGASAGEGTESKIVIHRLTYRHRRRMYRKYGAVPVDDSDSASASSDNGSDHGYNTRSTRQRMSSVSSKSSRGARHLSTYNPTVGFPEAAASSSETRAVDEVWYSQDPYTLGNRYRVKGSPAQPAGRGTPGDAGDGDGNGDGDAEGEDAEREALLGRTSASAASVAGPSAAARLYAAMNSGNHVLAKEDIVTLIQPLAALCICVFLLTLVSRYNGLYIAMLRVFGLDTRADEASGGSGVELLFRALQLTVMPIGAAAAVTVAALGNRVYLPLGGLLAAPLRWCRAANPAVAPPPARPHADCTNHYSGITDVSPSAAASSGWLQALQRMRVYVLPMSWLLRNPLFMLLSSAKLLYATLLMMVPSIYLVLRSPLQVFVSFRTSSAFACFGERSASATEGAALGTSMSASAPWAPQYECQWLPEASLSHGVEEHVCNLKSVLNLYVVVLVTNVLLGLLLSLLVELPVWRLYLDHRLRRYRVSHQRTGPASPLQQTEKKQEHCTYNPAFPTRSSSSKAT